MSAATFNGSFVQLPGAHLRRRNQGGGSIQTRPNLPGGVGNTDVTYVDPSDGPVYVDTSRPNLPNQAQASQRTMSPGPVPNIPNAYQQAALRANMSRNVYANTLAANNPATANLPHVQAAIAARNITNEGIAQQAGLGQNYFQGREMTADANTRANEMNSANVGGVYAQTDSVNQDTRGKAAMLPYQTKAAELANYGTSFKSEAQNIENQYAPGKYQSDLNMADAQRGKTVAETDQIKNDGARVAAQNKQYHAQMQQQQQAFQKQQQEWQQKLDASEEKYKAVLAQLAAKGVDPGSVEKEIQDAKTKADQEKNGQPTPNGGTSATGQGQGQAGGASQAQAGMGGVPAYPRSAGSFSFKSPAPDGKYRLGDEYTAESGAKYRATLRTDGKGLEWTQAKE